MSRARLIHLNGPPGIGKSTLARRYAAEHAGVLLCDVDVLRTMIGGWQEDDGAAGRARTAALALITGYLGTGHDVVLPQLVARDDQLSRFTAAARAASARPWKRRTRVSVSAVSITWTCPAPAARAAAVNRDSWSSRATSWGSTTSWPVPR